MDRPVHFVCALMTVVAGSTLLGAEEDSPKRSRAVSPHVAQTLAEASARQPGPAPLKEAAAPVESAARLRITAQDPEPAASIVRMSPYIVRDIRVPPREEVTTRKELEKYAMQKYLGDETSLDRAMNMIGPATLWKKIPLLGKIPLAGFITNEDRAMQMYEAERMRTRWEEANSLLALTERERVLRHPDQPAPGK